MKRKDKITLLESEHEELVKQANDLRAKIAGIKLERYTKPAKNTREVKNLRYKLAVILTAKRSKEMHHG